MNERPSAKMLIEAAVTIGRRLFSSTSTKITTIVTSSSSRRRDSGLRNVSGHGSLQAKSTTEICGRGEKYDYGGGNLHAPNSKQVDDEKARQSSGAQELE